jgi:hypothetical protein
MRYLLIVLVCIGCVPPAPPKFTDEEKLCLAASEVIATRDVASCGANVDGPCSSDAIVNRQQERDEECIK